jgi:hypothetical protein
VEQLVAAGRVQSQGVHLLLFRVTPDRATEKLASVTVVNAPASAHLRTAEAIFTTVSTFGAALEQLWFRRFLPVRSLLVRSLPLKSSALRTQTLANPHTGVVYLWSTADKHLQRNSRTPTAEELQLEWTPTNDPHGELNRRICNCTHSISLKEPHSRSSSALSSFLSQHSFAVLKENDMVGSHLLVSHGSFGGIRLHCMCNPEWISLKELPLDAYNIPSKQLRVKVRYVSDID